MSPRVTAQAYAEMIGMSHLTVERWCKNMLLPEGERNPNLPPMVARKRGRSWAIDVEATERAQVAVGGNPIERDMLRAAQRK